MITILLVRHADIDLPPHSADPSLNEAGRDRAEALAHVAGAAGVTTVFTSSLRRTKETAEPISKLAGTACLEMPPPAVVAREIRAGQHGPVVLIVGHSNTVPEVIVALGSPSPPAIHETEFDNLFVVTLPESGLLALRYGIPSVDPMPSV